MNSISSESANSPRRRRWLSTAIKEPLRELSIQLSLLRLARVTDDGLCAPVVDRPDQWWAVPAQLRIDRPGGA